MARSIAMVDAPPIPQDHQFPCKQCGAKVQFAPGTTSLTCPYCSTVNEIEVAEVEVQEQDFESYLQKLSSAKPQATVEVVKCGACGAEVRPPESVTSFKCCFCGTDIVSESRSCSVIQPEGVLPFKVTREEAVKKFRGWIGSLWWAPNKLKKQAMVDSAISGLYMPAWTYDAIVDTTYRGQRGDAYYVTVGSGKNSRRERRVNWRYAAGRVHNEFDDVLVLATRSLPEDKAKALDPWDLKEVLPFNPQFLAGFSAERYQIDLKQGFDIAKTEMAMWIETAIRNDIGGDEQRIEWKESHYYNITFKHLLLPVWLSAYRYQGKVFRFMVNARTGEVQGERPYSPWKIAFAVIGGVIALSLLIWLITSG